MAQREVRKSFSFLFLYLSFFNLFYPNSQSSLTGEYSKEELYKIKNALSDKVLERGELSKKVMNELRDSKDLDKIKDQGFTVEE